VFVYAPSMNIHTSFYYTPVIFLSPADAEVNKRAAWISWSCISWGKINNNKIQWVIRTVMKI
jgi:hypothetical protein